MYGLVNFKSYDEVKKHFKVDLGLGEKSTYGGTIQVATKGEAKLLAAVNFAKVEVDGVPRWGIRVDFVGRFVTKDTFSPHLKPVQTLAEDAVRYAPVKFLLCPITSDPRLSFSKQNVGAQLTSWLKDLCYFLGATPVEDFILNEIVHLTIPKDFAVEDADLFSLDQMVASTEAPQESEDSEDEESEDDSDEDNEDPEF